MRRAVALSLVLAAAALAAAAGSAAPRVPAALAQDDAKPVEEGAAAPDFKLKDQDGNEVALSSYRGKRVVVLAFYPKAMTPGCTREMKCFTADWKKVEDRGAQILAISGDPVPALKQFHTSIGARFPMLSDAGLGVAKRYGVYTASPDGGFATRSVFVVDREGTVRWAQRDYGVPTKLEGNDLLAKLDLLRPATVDPAEGLAALPSPEKEAKTTLVRWVQALLAEDLRRVDGLLHREFGAKAGQTAEMAAVRRQAEMDRVRKLVDAHDLKALAFDDVLDVRDARIGAKADAAKPGYLGGFSEEAKKASAEVPAGDVFLVARTKAPKVGDAPLVPRELWVVLRKDGEAWKILSLAGR